MRAVPASFPAFGIDTVQTLSAANCAALRALGYSFVCRYFGGLTPNEISTILAAGLAYMPVTYSRKPGWVPTPGMGTKDGLAAVTRAKYLGVPPNTTCWLDLEGCSGSAAATTTWVNEWAVEIKAAGFDPGLYVGYSPGGLDANGLWKLKVDRYWRAPFSIEPEKCGPCMFQLYPLNIALAGARVDVDVIQQDRLNRLPNWVTK
jgi:hypothetical protein